MKDERGQQRDFLLTLFDKLCSL